jgi:DedD protein
MDEMIKQRLVGASVLAVIAAFLLPWLFGHPQDPSLSIQASFSGTPLPERGADEIVAPVALPSMKQTTLAPSASALERAREAPKPSRPPAEAVKQTSGQADRQWVLQLASYREADAADAFLLKLRKDRYDAYRERVNVKGKTYYRVRLKLGGDRDSAQAKQKIIEKTYRVQAQLYSAR